MIVDTPLTLDFTDNDEPTAARTGGIPPLNSNGTAAPVADPFAGMPPLQGKFSSTDISTGFIFR